MSEPETPAVVAETSPPQQEQITAPAVAKNTVRLEYTEDSWTEIKDANGKRLMFDLVKAGTKKEINGDMPISIVLGNARGVKVIYHNEVFDTSPYLQGNMAYFTLK
jgi:cytoskeleton protein RodZ